MKDESNEQIISSFREIRKLINLFNEGTCEDSEKGLLDPELIATMVNLVVAKNFKNLELMEEIFWILINFTYFQSPLMIFFKGSVMIKTCIKIVFSDESEFLINNVFFLIF